MTGNRGGDLSEFQGGSRSSQPDFIIQLPIGHPRFSLALLSQILRSAVYCLTQRSECYHDPAANCFFFSHLNAGNALKATANQNQSALFQGYALWTCAAVLIASRYLTTGKTGSS